MTLGLMLISAAWAPNCIPLHTNF